MPIEALVNPLPIELTTPPVTKMCFVIPLPIAPEVDLLPGGGQMLSHYPFFVTLNDLTSLAGV